jgi:hypothetical protein
MITVVTWLWGTHFGAEYVNKLRNMVARNLHMPHQFVCVTDPIRKSELGEYVNLHYAPSEFSATPNCIRRMKMYDPRFAWALGKYVLMLDVDIVITGDITPMTEAPLKAGADLALWKVGYPNHNRIYAGGIVLQRAGVLEGMWNAFLADPLGFGTRALKHTYNRTPGEGWGAISDQAMLNYWMHGSTLNRHEWTTEIQPFTPKMTMPPSGTKIVTIGHENLELFQRHIWAQEFWR